ncbi:hypothetical protein QJS10_CPB12g00807 [Acorus calamus]|uniref:Endonuclease/exonuclease/phosphatase n=1 Tax=Acorus calamus TaxID=4465 RepID=A0AAV9DPT0_ACOCL|nr:hypothetical protein QJS10_CPB12g00807 [Acorus calamus]
MVSGDFNEVCYSSEKQGGRPIHSRRANKFNRMISKELLMDLKATGQAFSWSNQQSNRIVCRLDRTLGNSRWLQECPEGYFHYHSQGISDHAAMEVFPVPVLLTGSTPFKYYKMWEEHPDFLNTVQRAWNIYVPGSAMFQLASKLTNTKKKLKYWNWNVFGPIQRSLQERKRALSKVQELLSTDPLNHQLIEREEESRQSFMEALRVEEIFVRQKSRENWLKAGDSNTKFFYSSIAQRKSRNSIRRL